MRLSRSEQMKIVDQIEQVNARRNWDVILAEESGLTVEQRRARLIGASDVAALMRLIPFKGARGPWDVYMDLYGLRARQPMNLHMRKGLILEPLLAQIYAETTGNRLFKAAETLPHPQLAVLTVHVDRLAQETLAPKPNLTVEMKMVGWRVKKHWDDGIPAYVLTQVMAQMSAWGISQAHVPVDFDDELSIFQAEIDREVETVILEAVEAFWRDYIVPMKPPDYDGSSAAGQYLLQKYPKASEKLVQAPDEAILASIAYLSQKTSIEALEARLGASKQHIQELIGDNKGFMADGWKAQWYDVRGASRTDWKAVQRDLIGHIEPDLLASIIEYHTKKSPDRRDFRFEST